MKQLESKECDHSIGCKAEPLLHILLHSHECNKMFVTYLIYSTDYTVLHLLRGGESEPRIFKGGGGQSEKSFYQHGLLIVYHFLRFEGGQGAGETRARGAECPPPPSK
jgi:hypothetical protein